MDNASYHNTFAEKVPNSNSKKADMQEWLTYKNIEFREDMKKIELYDIILKHKDNSKNYAIDAIAKENDIDILRLPPYHPDLNPIEKIWGVLKNYVANRNIDQNYTSILNLINERLAMINVTIWDKTCQHVEETENKYWKDYDDEQEFTIYVGDSESDNDTSSFYDSDENSISSANKEH
ncbi:hypothetical protein EVAR_37971_1 [Eumeta japonica]|nr:hypothetical protein EVAR_37971_1 [Eumeta japonica]